MVRLTRHGWREMLVGTIVLLAIASILGWLLVWWAGLIVLPVLGWLFAFFRDPDRSIPAGPNLMISPADGTVSDIGEVEHPDLGGACTRVGIFLSVFNVHVNRSPCLAKVLAITYKPGSFGSALNHSAASANNESNSIVLADESGQTIAVVKQISGLIARRIVCTAAVGDTLARGQHIGMIKFGSRTELYIANRLSPVVNVQIGQKVRGGADIIATLGSAGPQTAHEGRVA